jgi:hypothetical protein
MGQTPQTPQMHDANEAQAKAAQLLKQARAAIGSEAQLSALTGLSAALTSHRTVGTTQQARDIEYDILLPDKFRRRESSEPFTTVTVMDDDSISTRSIPNPAANAGGDPLRENSNYPQAQMRRRADFLRVLLSLMLALPAAEAAQYSYVGEWREPDGSGDKADMIDVAAKDGFAARLYLDQKTHRLMALTYRGQQLSYALRATANRMESAPSLAKTASPAARREALEKRRDLFEVFLSKAPLTDYRWVFADYKNVKGVSLPHALTKSEAGHDYEEWAISLFKLNPKLTAAMFAQPQK